jgi:hypothetical protein
MLPGHLIAEFWATVEKALTERHRLTPEQAQQGIADYRARLDLRRVGEMIYHEEPERVAGTIAGAVQQGGFQVLDPLPSS